ncbi:hypothetical protein Vretimale_7471 [Volvox reticuliferus]|uniref:Nocturnin n=1 Tax=Volvox reticuliferus TaxID=1737510 RepID=A0A8J4G9B5_9CHLO|nr:hypothetical protein Vretifemale_7502 [Volvox reticuliferus]GIM02586.1 hypothetical protein Vretimale_7471 [Volvox reticuliferus]
MVQWKEFSSKQRLPDAQARLGSLSFTALRPLWRMTVPPGGLCKRVRMTSLECSVDSHGAISAVSTRSSKCKIKRTPVILNYPRKPDVARFRVLQWNVLADGLAQNGDFCRAPPLCLEWEYRRPLLLQEILEANADIICLQELNHFDELSQVLSSLGYDGAFREKHASPALKYEFPPDGMAVFFRRNRFRCCANGVEGRSFHDDWTGREQSQGYLQILLYDMMVGRELLIVTTHLKAKDGAECEDVRLRQAGQLLRNVEVTLQRLDATAAGNGGNHASTGGNGNGNSAGSGGDGGQWRQRGAAVGGGNGTAAPAAAADTAADTGAESRSNCNGNGTNSRSNGNGGHGVATTSAPGTEAGSCSTHRDSVAAGSEAPSSTQNDGRYGGGSQFRIPVVITGDFNTMPGSKTCEAFRGHPLCLLSLWEQRPLNATLSSESGSDMELPPQMQLQQQSYWQGPGLDGPSPQPVVENVDVTATTVISNSGMSKQQQQMQQMTAEAAALGSVSETRSSLCSGEMEGGVAPKGWSEFSTWKFRVKGESKRISDYIWFSGAGKGGARGPLRPLQRWRMLTEEEIGPGALPSAAYGSDHVSLCCEFEWDVDADLEWVPLSREADWG